MKLKCSECRYREKRCKIIKNKAPNQTEECVVEQIVSKNQKLLQQISAASSQRFVDEENVEESFKIRLNQFFDVLSVLYSMWMDGYYPENNASKEQKEIYQTYQGYRHAAYNRCIQQVKMRILTLGRASCGFVGEFSSGKSSYLNAEVFGYKLLPEGVGQTTSIPTYIFSGWKDKVVIENLRGNVSIWPDFEVLKQLSHSSMPEGCPCRFEWDAVIQRLFCFSSHLKHNPDLVYVDLPGYSASEGDNRSMKETMEGCDKIVYFKPIGSGGLNNKDLEYLKALDNVKEVMLVLSKADMKPPADCEKTLDFVKETLKEQKIEIENVILYTNRPEKFGIDSEFYKKLNGYKNQLNEFIFNSSVKDTDMSLSNAMMQFYADKYLESEGDVIRALEGIEKMSDDFLGKRELDASFFKSWKMMNKDIADSSGNYVDQHWLSENTVRSLDYVKMHQSRIDNKYMSDTYDSKFNYSFQFLMYELTSQYLYKTAFCMQLTKSAYSNYQEACSAIDSMEHNYEVVKKNMNYIFTVIKNFFGYYQERVLSIRADAQCAYASVAEAYEKLINYVKKYEKEWLG